MTQDSETGDAPRPSDIPKKESNSSQLSASERVRRAFASRRIPRSQRRAPVGVIIPVGGDATAEARGQGERIALVESDEQRARENEARMQAQQDAILAPYVDGISELAQKLHLQLDPKRRKGEGASLPYDVESSVKGLDDEDYMCRLQYKMGGVVNRRFSEIIYTQSLNPNNQPNSEAPRIVVSIVNGKINYVNVSTGSTNENGSSGRDFWDEADRILGIDSTIYTNPHEFSGDRRGHNIFFYPQGVLESGEPTVGYNIHTSGVGYHVYNPVDDDFYKSREIGRFGETVGPDRMRLEPLQALSGGKMSSFDGDEYHELLQRALITVPLEQLPQ